MSITNSMSNPGKLDFLVQGWLEGGSSTRNGESLEVQVAFAPERALQAPLITWASGPVSVLQQLAFNAQGIGRIETRQAAQQELLQQIANALSNGVALEIDYGRIEASIKAAMPELPEYELTVKEPNQ